MENSDIVRTKKLGCFRKVGSPHWGTMLIQAEDPLGEEDFCSEDITSFQLADDFPRIPSKLWEPVISLFEYMSPIDYEGEDLLETSVVLLRKEDGNYKEWRILVPLQKVDEVAVKAKLDGPMCDIITGEEVTGIPDGWSHAGSAHSHNIMSAYFSETDNEDELSIPGLHAVVGEIGNEDGYAIKASIVLRGIRKEISASEVINLKRLSSVSYHPNVLNYIKKPKLIFNQHESEIKELEQFERHLDKFDIQPYKTSSGWPLHLSRSSRSMSEKFPKPVKLKDDDDSDSGEDDNPTSVKKLPKEAQLEIKEIQKKIKKFYRKYPKALDCFLPWDF